MERFRRFVTGLDPVLQVNCHEHGATALEALAIAGKWERAQEALRLAPPHHAGFVPSTEASSTNALQSVPHLTAMVSPKAASGSDQTPELLSNNYQLMSKL